MATTASAYTQTVAPPVARMAVAPDADRTRAAVAEGDDADRDGQRHSAVQAAQNDS